MVGGRSTGTVGPRSRRSRRLALHVGLDRPAQGGDAEPRQYVARRGQRRSLSAAGAATTGCSPCCRSASTTARTSCSRPGPRAPASCRSTISPRATSSGRSNAIEISTLAGVPPLWVQLIEAPWPAAAALSLRRLTNSGGKLAPSVVRRLREVFPAADIYSMYGLTEAFRSTYLEPALLDDHPEFDGQRNPLRRDHGVGADGAEAAEGELVHAGPLVAKGYWQRSRAHRRAVQAGAGRLGLWRHGGLVGRPGPPRRARPALFRRPRGRR